MVDLKDMLFNDHRKIFKELKDPNKFKKFKIEFDTLSWENGLDLALEFLYDLLLNSPYLLPEKRGEGKECDYPLPEKRGEWIRWINFVVKNKNFQKPTPPTFFLEFYILLNKF